MTGTLNQYLPANIFAVMLVFCRVGSALMVLPGFGDLYVPARYRLLLGAFLAMLLATALATILPAQPDSPLTLMSLLGGEIVIGLFIGSIGRLMLSALETAGAVISLQLGLSAAQIFNPALAQQTAITGAFLTVFGVLLIFMTDTHHLLLRGMIASYGLFPPGTFPGFGDMSDTVTRIVSASFRLAIELSAPFIVLGTVFFVALGFLARLMPQLQIFFVVLPVQVAGGLVVFAFTLYAVMQWFLDDFVQTVTSIVPQG
ncbi:MAG TPA: flagellar biosynthetic protein FliR [Stellaceae bacterium]|nr:flagellar biosynthetic protein FliR [Stellaceae bacterium]